MNKNFKAKVNTEREGKDIYLSITHNGRTWHQIAIKDPEYEIPLIIEALRRHLTGAVHSDGEDKDASQSWTKKMSWQKRKDYMKDNRRQ